MKKRVEKSGIWNTYERDVKWGRMPEGRTHSTYEP